MKKTFMTLFLLLACSLALTAAQYQNQPQTDQDQQDQQNMPSSSQAGNKMTFTGCLQSGVEPNSYVLNNVTPSDMSQQSLNQQDQEQQEQAQNPDLNQGQEGSQPSELARASEKSFNLIPEGRVDLKNYIGKRVEVTGKMIQSTSRTTQSSRATTPSGQSSSIHSSTEMTEQPQFQVSSVRQIASSCQ